MPTHCVHVLTTVRLVVLVSLILFRGMVSWPLTGRLVRSRLRRPTPEGCFSRPRHNSEACPPNRSIGTSTSTNLEPQLKRFAENE